MFPEHYYRLCKKEPQITKNAPSACDDVDNVTKRYASVAYSDGNIAFKRYGSKTL